MHGTVMYANNIQDAHVSETYIIFSFDSLRTEVF
jgi:hypothetical protein